MKNIRVIPLLNIKGSNVVKPVQTEALRVVGNPQEMFLRYYEEGADELIYLDIVASLYQRNLDFALLKTITEKVFIPVTAGGGIRTIQDINNALRAGADKVAINTYATKNPEFLRLASREFGSQCITLFIEAKKQPDGHYLVYTDGGREKTGLDVYEWAQNGVELGAGEILICSIDRDGTRRGYDTELIKKISQACGVPVIAHGGAGDKNSFLEAVREGKADALVASSVFHYKDHSIKELKAFLKTEGINVRTV